MRARCLRGGADRRIVPGDLETENFDSLRDELAGLAGELRDEKQGNLENLPDAFQQGGELYEQVDALDS